MTVEPYIRLHEIVDAVAHVLRASPGEMVSPSRHAEVVAARDACVYLMRNMTTASFPEIAKALGYKSHSSAVDAMNRATGRMFEVCEDRPSFSQNVAACRLRVFAVRALLVPAGKFRADYLAGRAEHVYDGKPAPPKM